MELEIKIDRVFSFTPLQEERAWGSIDGDRWAFEFLGLRYVIEQYEGELHATVDRFWDTEPLGSFKLDSDGVAWREAQQVCFYHFKQHLAV